MAGSPTQGMGATDFVAQHGLWSSEQSAAGDQVEGLIRAQALRTVRIVVVDQHGLGRSKALSPDAYHSATRNGADFSGAIYSLDTSNAVFPPPFAPGGGFGIPELTGFPDVIVVPDPTTFRVLPWADRTGWVLCDAYLANGRPMPLDSRRVLRTQLAAAAELGYGYLAGLEVEFYLLALAERGLRVDQTGMPAPAPDVRPFEAGYQFLSENRQAYGDAALDPLRDALWNLGLPPRSMEKEWGPGQIEVTFAPMAELAAADAMILFRAAAKQVLRRQGLLATFMAWPALPNFFPSGWHLHESLTAADATNAFASDTDVLSPVGRAYAAGLLEHSAAMTLLASPTINGIRRYRPYSFAPDRICWGLENRGVSLRAQGAPGDTGAHLENRLGEPAANPYLYQAGSLAAGLDGVRRELTPPPLVEGDPYAVEGLPPLPTSMRAAIDALDASAFYRGAFGDPIVDYLVMMKRAELARFDDSGDHGEGVTPWEMNEYLEVF